MFILPSPMGLPRNTRFTKEPVLCRSNNAQKPSRKPGFRRQAGQASVTKTRSTTQLTAINTSHWSSSKPTWYGTTITTSVAGPWSEQSLSTAMSGMIHPTELASPSGKSQGHSGEQLPVGITIALRVDDIFRFFLYRRLTCKNLGGNHCGFCQIVFVGSSKRWSNECL